MHRVTAAFFTALISLTSLHAENIAGISAGAGPAFPLRGVRRLLGTGYGGTGSIDFLLNDNISIVARGGYFRWQFNNERFNTWVAATGGRTAPDAGGPFQAIPVTVGARFTFDGSPVRPYFGLAGGACLLHWKIAGTSPATGLPGGYSSTWTEPAMSVEAGLTLVLSGRLTFDVGGTYTAYANAEDRVDPSDFLGVRIAEFNTATFVGVQAGFRVAF
jgi:opacity protein-like surface antigen